MLQKGRRERENSGKVESLECYIDLLNETKPPEALLASVGACKPAQCTHHSSFFPSKRGQSSGENVSDVFSTPTLSCTEIRLVATNLGRNPKDKSPRLHSKVAKCTQFNPVTSQMSLGSKKNDASLIEEMQCLPV